MELSKKDYSLILEALLHYQDYTDQLDRLYEMIGAMAILASQAPK